MVKMPYVQELPPKSGYPQIPYKRHIPVRGVGAAGCFGILAIGGFMWWVHAHSTKRTALFIENENKLRLAGEYFFLQLFF